LQRTGYDVVTIRKYPVMRPGLVRVAKELLKVVLPRYQSRIRYYLYWAKYSKVDMYIRAKASTTGIAEQAA